MGTPSFFSHVGTLFWLGKDLRAHSNQHRYATNLMVWSPGGYRFVDYVKIGLPLAITHVILGSLLIPVLWPF